jgi:epsilon-lactone hydrolase
MTTTRQRVLDAISEAYSFATPDSTLEQVRQGYDTSMARGRFPDGVSVTDGKVAGVAGSWFQPREASARVILFLHGGGYLFGSSRSHGPLAAHIARESGAAVFVADYRRAPEAPFPAAVHDALAVLRELVELEGAANVVVAGDSAGGGLVLATLLAAKQAGNQMPAAAVTLSAWADLALDSASITELADVDPLMTREQLEANAAAYLGERDRRNPLASPVYGDLSGLPPLYMQVGTEEILRDDTHRVASAVRAAGGSVTVDVQDGMPHVHQILLWSLPEASVSVDRIGQFIRALPVT